MKAVRKQRTLPRTLTSDMAKEIAENAITTLSGAVSGSTILAIALRAFGTPVICPNVPYTAEDGSEVFGAYVDLHDIGEWGLPCPMLLVKGNSGKVDTFRCSVWLKQRPEETDGVVSHMLSYMGWESDYWEMRADFIREIRDGLMQFGVGM